MLDDNDLLRIGQLIAQHLAPIQRDVSDIKSDVEVLKTDVAGLKTDVAVLKTDVAGLKTDVAGLKTDVAGLKTDVAMVSNRVDILSALHSNSLKGRDDVLTFVPLANGRMPSAATPRTLSSLLVSGNETLPDAAGPACWNREKSLALIREYDPTYESDGSGDELVSSRRRRLKVAQCLGITRAQLNFAQMEL